MRSVIFCLSAKYSSRWSLNNILHLLEKKTLEGINGNLNKFIVILCSIVSSNNYEIQSAAFFFFRRIVGDFS